MAVPFLWTAFILFLYSIPGYKIHYEEPWEIIKVDKLAHFGMFAMMSLTLLIAFSRQEKYPQLRKSKALISLAFSIIYGGILESIQGQFFVQRTSDILDFAANSIGAFMGYLAFRLLFKKDYFRP